MDLQVEEIRSAIAQDYKPTQQMVRALMKEHDCLTQLCEEQGRKLAERSTGNCSEKLCVVHGKRIYRLRRSEKELRDELRAAESALSQAREEVAAVKEESYRILKTTAAAMEKLKQTCDSDCREYLKDQEAAEQREKWLQDKVALFAKGVLKAHEGDSCITQWSDNPGVCVCDACEEAKAALAAASEVGE